MIKYIQGIYRGGKIELEHSPEASLKRVSSSRFCPTPTDGNLSPDREEFAQRFAHYYMRIATLMPQRGEKF